LTGITILAFIVAVLIGISQGCLDYWRDWCCGSQTSSSTENVELLERLQHTPKKVTIVGSGNWGSAIARNVGSNAKVFIMNF
jgi:hypothetical protein